MALLPVLPIILPLLGAAGTAGLLLLPRFTRPYARYAANAVALLATGLTTILLLFLRWGEPLNTVPSLWQPSLLFGSTLALQFDGSVYPLAFALALITFSSTLAEFGRSPGESPRLVPTMLALLSLGLFSLCAGNVLTLLLGWTLYDALLAAGQVAAGGSPRQAMRGLFLRSLATLLLWAGALVSDDGASARLWPLMPISAARGTLWAMAGLLRIWAYPFHLSAPDGLGSAPGTAPLFLGPVIGWGLWLRLVSASGGAIPGQGWVSAFAVLTMAVGGFLAWSCEDPRRTLPWIGVSVTGATLLAAVSAGPNAGPVISAGGAAWALSIAVLLMCAGLMREGLRRKAVWWGAGAWIGALTLVGVPLTLGFVTMAPLIGGLVREGPVGTGVAFVVAQASLVPSLVRWLMLPIAYPLPSGRRSVAIWVAGLGLPALTLAVTGVTLSPLVGGLELPSLGELLAIPTLPGWLIWTVSLAIGGLLAWQERNIRPRIEHLLGVGHDLWRLEWLYTAATGALDRGLSLFRAADDVVGGTGALLWSTVLCLILLLIWSA